MSCGQKKGAADQAAPFSLMAQHKHLTRQELDVARRRIAEWPSWDRTALTRLTEQEARLIALAVAVLDIRPGDSSRRGEELIDLR